MLLQTAVPFATLAFGAEYTPSSNAHAQAFPEILNDLMINPATFKV